VRARPTQQMLQPEATGAATEVTNWVKRSDSVSRIGDCATDMLGVQPPRHSATLPAIELRDRHGGPFSDG
jgi:hypothetical protein